MQNVTSAFRRALAEDRRDYLLKAVITLADGTVLSESIPTELPDGMESVDTHAWLSNYSIWQNGFTIEDAVSADNVFQVGAAIINKATVVINNIYEQFDAYDFKDATVVLSVGLSGLDNGTTEYVKKGIFVVDEATYNGSLITLSCLDYMAKFDKPYVTTLTGSVTLGTIVGDMCTRVGVSLATNSLNFPHKDYLVEELPSGDSTTYRQVLSWVAQIAGCFARINVDGELELKWYDRATLEEQASDLDGGTFDSGTPTYISGDTADGGSFNPWDTGAEIDGGIFTDVRPIHYITSSFTHKISTDDVVITGVKVIKKVKTEGSSDAFYEYTSGTSGYMIVIENNDLIQGANGQNIANWLGTQLIGFTFRKADITHLSDPTIEAGDVALYWDRKSNVYSIIVSSTRFAAGNSQQTSSSAETPRKNSAAQFTEATRNYVEMRKQMQVQRSSVQEAMDDLAERIANSSGLYVTEVVESGKTKFYYHDKPLLNESQIVMLFSDAGFTLTADYQTPASQGGPTWYGMTVDGQFIAAILNTIGINADWINTGQLVIKDQNNNETFFADTQTGVVRIAAESFSLTGGSLTSSWSGDGVPTNSNYPAVNWDTSALKEQHLGDIYYDNTGTGIYKYSEIMEGFRVTFTGTYEFTGTGDAFVIAFLYDGNWYRIVNPFENGNVSTSIFIPTEYTYSSYPAFFVRAVVSSSGLTYDLTYEVSKTYDVFPDAELYGTTRPYYGAPYSRLLNVEYTMTSGGLYDYAWYFDTTIDTTLAPGWKSINALDEYARSLAQQASDAVDDFDAGLYGQAVLNRLSNNGAIQGMWIENGRLYISFTSARGGTLTLGGTNDEHGQLILYDGNGDLISHFNNEWALFANPVDDYVARIEDAVLTFGFDETIQSSTGSGQSYNIASIGLNDVSDGSWESYEALVIEQIRANSGVIIRGSGSYQGNEVGMEVIQNHINLFGYIKATGAFSVTGSKSRVVENTSYGAPTLYCYETPTPYFGDIGTAKTDDNGEAIVSIDDIFGETINANVEYSVFLQKEGPGDIWVDKKEHSYFIVKGTPNLKFSWEIKVVQSGFEMYRLDDDELRRADYIPEDGLEQLMEQELKDYDKEMEELYQ